MRIAIPPDHLVTLTPGASAVHHIELQIAEKVLSGQLPVGASLPATRALAAALGVSSFTVMDAYQRLSARGLIEGRKKAAYTVCARHTAPKPLGDTVAQRIKDYAWLLQEAPRTRLGHSEMSGSNLPRDWEDHRIAQRALRAVASMGESVLHAPVEALGYQPLREVLQTRLQALGLRCQRDEILVTGGATAAVGLLAALLVHPGDTVLVDDPGFFALHGLLHLRGAKVIGVPRTPAGPDLAQLAALIERHQPRLFIVQSVLHSPTGSSIRPDVALALLTLAQNSQLRLIECDFYADLACSRHLRLAELATLASVIYVGACAKTVTGTARIGYIACPAELSASIGKLKLLYGSANPPIHERVAYRALTDPHCARHISRLSGQLRDVRVQAQLQLVEAGFVIFDTAAQGKYLWAMHPAFSDSADLAEQLEKHQISLAPGRIFRPDGLPTAWFRVNVSACVGSLVKSSARLTA